MNKLRRFAAALVAATTLVAVAAPAATAAPSPRAAERSADRPLWSSNYLMGTVRDWPCAGRAPHVCGVYSKTARAHYLVTFDQSGDVSSIVKRRTTARDV